MTANRAALRIYRSLLRLYPSGFRAEYGADMICMVEEQLAEESTARVLSRAAIDLIVTIPSQHMEAHMKRNASRLVPRLSTAWWKLMISGPCLVGVVIIGAAIGIEAWFLGFFAVLLAVALTAMGLILGLVRVAQRQSRTTTA